MAPFIKILLFVFLLLLCCTSSLPVYASSPAAPKPASSVLFDKDKIDPVQKSSGGSGDTIVDGITLTEIKLPLFVAVKDSVMVAVAEAQYKKNGNSNGGNVGVVAKYFEINDKPNWGNEVIENVKTNWKPQLATEESDKQTLFFIARAAFVNENKIFIFLLNITDQSDYQDWKFKLVEGAVNGDGQSKTIKWTTTNLTVSEKDRKTDKKLDKDEFSLALFDGSVLLTKNNKIVCVVKGKNAGKQNVALLFQLDKTDNSFKLLNEESSTGLHSTFFQWEGKIFKIPTNSGSDKVMEFNASQKFIDSKDSIARLRDFLKDKSDFTTATIGDKSVLLCTQQKDVNGNKNVYLWMTDGTRVSCAGTIIENIKDIFCGSVLHTKKELFALHHKYNTADGGNGKIVENTFSLTRLPTQLKNITDTLDAWKNNQTVSKLCDNINKQKIICTKAPPRDGLVGFLYSTINEERTQTITWKDEYYFSDVAVVKGKAERVTNGLKFNGKGAGAKWSVGKRNDNFLYNFTDPGFALVATVEIGGSTNNNKNSILGISLTNTNNNVDLWCDTDGKWGVSGRDGQQKVPVTAGNTKCERDMTYNVALVLNENRNLDIYVNGEKLTTEKITIAPSESIEKFYFGANVESDESYVTVTNVLLYNRPFDPDEIQKLQNYVKSVEVVTPPDQAVGTNTAGGSSDEPTPPPIPTSTKGKGEDEKGPSPSRTEDGGVGGGVRVFSLLLALLCVSAPLLHL